MLDTLGDYVTEARRLLQDTRTPYRWPDEDYKAAVGGGLIEAYRLRRDLFLDYNFPSIGPLTNSGNVVEMEPMYRMGLLYYAVGHIKMNDDEEGAEGIGGAYKASFVQKLLTLAA